MGSYTLRSSVNLLLSFTVTFLRFIHVIKCQPFTQVSHYMEGPQSADSFSLTTLWSSPLLAVTHSAPVNIQVQAVVRMEAFTLLGWEPGMELLGYTVTQHLTFSGTIRLLSKVAAPLYSSFCKTSNVWGFQFLHVLVNACHHIVLIPLTS